MIELKPITPVDFSGVLYFLLLLSAVVYSLYLKIRCYQLQTHDHIEREHFKDLCKYRKKVMKDLKENNGRRTNSSHKNSKAKYRMVTKHESDSSKKVRSRKISKENYNECDPSVSEISDSFLEKLLIGNEEQSLLQAIHDMRENMVNEKNSDTDIEDDNRKNNGDTTDPNENNSKEEEEEEEEEADGNKKKERIYDEKNMKNIDLFNNGFSKFQSITSEQDAEIQKMKTNLQTIGENLKILLKEYSKEEKCTHSDELNDATISNSSGSNETITSLQVKNKSNIKNTNKENTDSEKERKESTRETPTSSNETLTMNKKKIEKCIRELLKIYKEIEALKDTNAFIYISSFNEFCKFMLNNNLIDYLNICKSNNIYREQCENLIQKVIVYVWRI